MKKIGITGGIGSGKSTTCSILKDMGYPIYYTDVRGKELSDTSEIIKEGLKSLFGKDIYYGLNHPPFEALDRTKLASIVFNDYELLRKVENIIHRVVKNDFKEWCEKQTSSICFVECALLFESEFDKEVDLSLMIYAPLERRINRLIGREGKSRKDILKIVNMQMEESEKLYRSDYLIVNDGEIPLIPQVNKFLKENGV